MDCLWIQEAYMHLNILKSESYILIYIYIYIYVLLILAPNQQITSEKIRTQQKKVYQCCENEVPVKNTKLKCKYLHKTRQQTKQKAKAKQKQKNIFF